jgi:hypothetical protein
MRMIVAHPAHRTLCRRVGAGQVALVAPRGIPVAIRNFHGREQFQGATSCVRADGHLRRIFIVPTAECWGALSAAKPPE